MSHETPTDEEMREQFPTPHDQAWLDRWLAAHDEQVRAEERERIAQAIEADWKGDFGWEDEPDHPYPTGMQRAARIARQGGSE